MPNELNSHEEDFKRLSDEYAKLDFTNDFMFCKILEKHEDICKSLLELILGKKIKKISYKNTQHAIKATLKGKGIRLDVYIEDEEETVYDLEMQAITLANFPKRTRYYQSVIDNTLISQGQDYTELKRSYIIFICVNNPFKERPLHIYTFRDICVEDTSITLDNDAYKIIITPDSDAEDIYPDMAAFLDYLAGKTPESALTRSIDDAINKARQTEEWRDEYMAAILHDLDIQREARKEGLSQGRIEAIKKLITKDMTKEFILSLDYSEEEYNLAKESMLQTV